MRDRLRALAVPVAIYLAITLALPAARAAARRRDLHALWHHAHGVVLGAVLVTAAIVAIGAILERVRTRANNRPTPRVCTGDSP